MDLLFSDTCSMAYLTLSLCITCFFISSGDLGLVYLYRGTSRVCQAHFASLECRRSSKMSSNMSFCLPETSLGLSKISNTCLTRMNIKALKKHYAYSFCSNVSSQNCNIKDKNIGLILGLTKCMLHLNLCNLILEIFSSQVHTGVIRETFLNAIIADHLFTCVMGHITPV